MPEIKFFQKPTVSFSSKTFLRLHSAPCLRSNDSAASPICLLWGRVDHVEKSSKVVNLSWKRERENGFEDASSPRQRSLRVSSNSRRACNRARVSVCGTRFPVDLHRQSARAAVSRDRNVKPPRSARRRDGKTPGAYSHGSDELRTAAVISIRLSTTEFSAGATAAIIREE